jgi:hypothetical protein
MLGPRAPRPRALGPGLWGPGSGARALGPGLWGPGSGARALGPRSSTAPEHGLHQAQIYVGSTHAELPRNRPVWTGSARRRLWGFERCEPDASLTRTAQMFLTRVRARLQEFGPRGGETAGRPRTGRRSIRGWGGHIGPISVGPQARIRRRVTSRSGHRRIGPYPRWFRFIGTISKSAWRAGAIGRRDWEAGIRARRPGTRSGLR